MPIPTVRPWAGASRGELPFQVMDEWNAGQNVNPNGNVVIDTPARPTAEDLSALAETCDLLVLPTTPDVLALDALVLTVEYLKKISSSHYRILITAIPPRPSKAGRGGEGAVRRSKATGISSGDSALCSVFKKQHSKAFRCIQSKILRRRRAGRTMKK